LGATVDDTFDNSRRCRLSPKNLGKIGANRAILATINFYTNGTAYCNALATVGNLALALGQTQPAMLFRLYKN